MVHVFDELSKEYDYIHNRGNEKVELKTLLFKD